MREFSFLLLYVQDPLASAAFYADLLSTRVVEQSPGFAMVPLRDGVMLGLWKRDAVEPKVSGTSGASEIAFTVGDKAAVDDSFAAWSKRGLTIAQTPVQLDFGYTFLALDPDGHRLRVFVPVA